MVYFNNHVKIIINFFKHKPNMKRILPLLILVAALGSRVSAQTASFNFSLNTQTVSGWTNVHGDPSTAVRTGTSSSITVSSLLTANWAPFNSAAAFDGGAASGGSFSLRR